MEDSELKMETKCFDANEYGYLYGLNQKIPDEEFEKVKPYFRKFKRMDFVEGNVQVTGRPEGWRCLEKDVSKVEEILGITNTLEKRQNKVKEALQTQYKRQILLTSHMNGLKYFLKKQEPDRNRTCQDLQSTQQKYTTLRTVLKTVLKREKVNCSYILLMECGTSLITAENFQILP